MLAAVLCAQQFGWLQFVPVDTIICFRASTPIIIAIIEFQYLGRELPSLRSWASLLGGSFLLRDDVLCKVLFIAIIRVHSASMMSMQVWHSVRLSAFP